MKIFSWNHSLKLIAMMLLGFQFSLAQVFQTANDWFVPGQTYLKVKVSKSGIYRLSATDLNLPVQAIPSNIHIIHRGVEQPIFVLNAGNVNQLDGNDYLEFYGLKCDGQQDKLMYQNAYTGLSDANEQANIYYSLYSDTSAYFITWDNTPGLRQTNFFDNNYSNFTAETNIRYQTHQNFVSRFNNSGTGAFLNENPDWVTGEGYTGNVFSTPATINFSTPSKYTASTNPVEYEVRLTGVSTGSHDVLFQIGSTSDSTSLQKQGIYIETVQFQGNISNISNTTALKVTGRGLTFNSTKENNALCYARATYDRTFNFSNTDTSFQFTWNNVNSTQTKMTFTGLPVSAGQEVILYNITNKIRIIGTVNGSNADFIIPKEASGAFFLSVESGIKKPVYVNSSLANHTGFTGAEFVIIAHKNFQNSAEKYATYRDTNTVNPLSAHVFYMDELFDEFSYGEFNPLAIKRFIKVALDNWTIKPRFILLWGKGLYEYRGEQINYVPTWGQPASDYHYVTYWDGTQRDYRTVLPIGRINVITDADGISYLNKVNDYEHLSPQIWMKKALHLGGGQQVYEQDAIQSYLLSYENTYESNPLGGDVLYHQKRTSGIVDTLDVRRVINEGVGQITFFGHSSSNIYDVEIEEPNVYTNDHIYPFMCALGCYSGNFAFAGRSFGEKFIIEPNKGAIGYWSTASTGYLGYLGGLTDIFYKVVYKEKLGERIGIQIQGIIDSMYNNPNTNNSQQYINHLLCSNLQCDPAIRLNIPSKPDLEITQASVTFDPSNVNAQTNPFKIILNIKNLGISFADSFKISVKQTILQTGQVILHDTVIHQPILNTDTAHLYIRIPSGVDPAGPNSFEIFVDCENKIDEFNENNNRIIYEKFIPSKLPICLLPSEFAVVNKDEITLMASTYSVTNQPLNYIFEVDTTYDFNTVFYRNSGVVSGTTFSASWKIPYTLNNHTVYYWRVSLPDEQGQPSARSSFKYIAGPREGWAQSRPPQYFENPTVDISMPKTLRQWNFNSQKVSIKAEMSGSERNFYWNGNFFSSLNSWSLSGGIFYSVMDKNTLRPITYNLDYFYWDFLRLPSGNATFLNILNNMNQGDYILMMAVGAGVNTWTADMIAAMKTVGVSTQFFNLGTQHRFIMVGRKGMPAGTAVEVFDYDNNGSAVLETDLYSATYKAEIYTKKIGPAKRWEDLIWDWRSLESNNVDQTKVSLYGVMQNGSEVQLLSNLDRGTHDLRNIDALVFPYLKLQANVSDSINRTAPQLDNWHILYALAPEALLDPTTACYIFEAETLKQGQSGKITLTARNITEINMDSLLVYFQLQTASGQTVLLDSMKLQPLLGLSEYCFSYTFDTKNYPGINKLIVTINPNFAQPEQYIFNNVYEKVFYVEPDNINPILDVIVDGKHIVDGDIVSAKPNILIEVNDENQYFVLDDTTAVEVYFKNNSSSAPAERVFFGNGLLQFTPATLPDNKAQVFYKPGHLEDGEYTLEVMGYDKTNNKSGRIRYAVSFKVINEATVTDVLPYPNPFSTQTRFVYTLTGTEIPEVFKIQLFTVTGILVKEIDLKANQDVFLGQNITETTWDGTDMYGDKLANGVYLYKVLIRLPGQQVLEKRNEKTSKYFEKGFGKVYLMR